MTPFDLLTPEQQKACAAVGVFPGDFNAEFYNRVAAIERDALARNIVELRLLDPIASAKIAADVDAALALVKP